MLTPVGITTMAEWLRRWTRNSMGSSRVDSNPTCSASLFLLPWFCCVIMRKLEKKREREITLVYFLLGELSQFFVSKSPYDTSTKPGKFSVSIHGPSTVFLDANETEYGYEVNIFSYKFT